MLILNLLVILLQTSQSIGDIVVFVIAAIVFILLFFYFVPVGFWFQAKASGVQLSLATLVFMRFRKVPPGLIVGPLIAANEEGIKLSHFDLEALYLAGGNVQRVINALIAAKRTNVNMDFKMASSIELKGNWNDVKVFEGEVLK